MALDSDEPPQRLSLITLYNNSRLYKLCRFVVTFSPVIMLITLVVPGMTAYFYIGKMQEPDCKRFPLVSHMGTYPPMSCFFTLFLSLGAFLLIVIATTLHYIILSEEQGRTRSAKRCPCVTVKCLNDAALVLGYIAALGVLVTGAFQSSALSMLHNVGVILFVFPGSVFMIIITRITRVQKKMRTGLARYWLFSGLFS